MAQQAVSRREHKERGDDGSKQRGKEGLGCGAVDASCREDPCPFQWTGQFRAPALKEALLGLEPLRRNERQCLLLLYKCPDQGSQTGMHAEHKSLDFRLLSSGAGGRRGQWMGLRLGGCGFVPLVRGPRSGLCRFFVCRQVQSHCLYGSGKGRCWAQREDGPVALVCGGADAFLRVPCAISRCGRFERGGSGPTC